MNMGKVTVTFRGRACATLIWVRVKGAQVYLEIRQPNGETPFSLYELRLRRCRANANENTDTGFSCL